MKKLLMTLLSGMLVIGNTSFVNAEKIISSDENEVILETEELNPEALHVQKIGEGEQDETEIEESVPYRLSDQIRVSIVLDEQSTMEAGYSVENISTDSAAKSYRNQLKSRQNEVTASIESVLNKSLDVKWNLTLTVNIISANVTYGDIAKIRLVDGVKDVFTENQYEPSEDEIQTANTSSGMVGATQTWAEGYTGAGSRIAIIDTGIDTTHQSFNSSAFDYAISEVRSEGKTVSLFTSSNLSTVMSELNASQNGVNPKYFTTKIPYGFNYIDNSQTITHVGDTEGEHGSHVAGIAAANRYIKSGSSYVDAAESVKAVGMAPDAQLFVMKVFGSGGGAYDSDYMAAIEDALVLGCDSINLSLGSSTPGFTYSGSYQNVMNSLVNNDYGTKAVVTISAGNNDALANNLGSDLYIEDISEHTGGSPGSFINSFGTASANNIGFTGTPLVFYGKNVFYTETLIDNVNALNTNTGTWNFVYIDDIGTAEAYSAVNNRVSLSNKVVIVNRGSSTFVEKANNATSYSPKIFLCANNQLGGAMGMSSDGYEGTCPFASISLEDAQMIKANATSGTVSGYTYYTGTVTVTNQMEAEIPEGTTATDAVMSDFSSWGVPGSLLMKPEITAPGGSIYSVFGTNTTTSGTTAGGSDQYELMSGTSMAAPHMAGLSAVLAQYVRENELSVEGRSARAINQSLLMSTAVPMMNDGQYVSVLQQGSGLVNVHNAVNAKSVIMMDENDGTLTAKTNAAIDGKVKAELGDNPNRENNYTYGFTIYNLSGEELTYDLSTDLFTQATDGTYMLQTTAPISGWTVAYSWDDAASANYDVDLSGEVNDLDAQAVLDYVTAIKAQVTYEGNFDAEAADANKDGNITTEDAYVILNRQAAVSSEKLVIPAGESKKVTVTIDPDHSMDEAYPNGYYVEGYTKISSDSTTSEGEIIDTTEYSIPILGFYGSWTDASMFDTVSYTDALYGSEEEPYAGSTDTNYLTVTYNGSSAKFAGNPYMVEETFPADKLALNSSSNIVSIRHTLLRSAGTIGFAFSKVNEYGGEITEVLDDVVLKNDVDGIWYRASNAAWYNLASQLYSVNKTPASMNLSEGDLFRVGYYAIPEYNAMMISEDMTDADAGHLVKTNEKDTFKQVLESENTLGRGAYVGYDFIVDDTKPVISNATLSGNTINISATDNINLAYLAVLSLDGDTVYAQKAPGTDTYTLSFDASDAIANAPGYVAAFAGDYAGNETAVAIKVNNNASSTKTVYKLTNTITSGGKYLIVNTNSAGSGYALGHSGSNVAADAVSIKADGNDRYIELSDVDSTSVWTVSGSSSYTFINNNYYLGRSNTNISIGTSITSNNRAWTWDGTNNRLSMSNYYLRYYNNTFSINRTANSVYLYQETTVSQAVDPDVVNEIRLTPESLDLYKGNTADLAAKVIPITVSDASITWTSSNTSVAEVDANGHVIAKDGGNAVITATSNSNPSVSASCSVTVTSINKTFNSILWDEVGGVYFASFNASSLPAYTKLHSDDKKVPLAAAFMYSSSALYADTVDSGSYTSKIYSVNRSSYALTESGDNYVMAVDMARAASGFGEYFVYAFARYLIFGNLAPETDDELGTYCGFPYGLLDVSTTIGDSYVAGIAAKSISSTSASYYFLDESGKIWETNQNYSSTNGITFSTPVLVIDTGITTDFLYQNLYYDGTYLYWSHTTGADAELIVINPSTGAIYNAGNFGDGVWPVGGIYVNGSVAPASVGETEETIDLSAELKPLATREELMTEDIIARFKAASSRETAGSLNSIRNYESKAKE
ncbi:MAG: S8 family serine peptidase, partial [Erysipelotrichaceae bacterium]|nr:S8 family serine peptidase [Erysipelotrichaceae bacterium]